MFHETILGLTVFNILLIVLVYFSLFKCTFQNN